MKKKPQIIKPVPVGVITAANFGRHDHESFLAGVNYMLTLNGHEPMKLSHEPHSKDRFAS